VAVGREAKDVQGFGQMTLWPRGGEISDLVVGSCYRRRGLGTAIIQYLVQVAREMYASSVEIGVAMDNTAALALYRRLGFTDDYTVMLNLGNGPEPVIYLQLELPPPESRSAG
jgi:ribosomal protein S18 acetylase RimI-like enzyme